MSQAERNIDLGGVPDPKASWARLPEPETLPLAWEVDAKGIPREIRVLGRTEGIVWVVRQASIGSSSRPRHNDWYCSMASPADVFATRDEAAMHGLQHFAGQIESMLKAVAEIVSISIEKKKAKG